jgi:hypothetical protein
MNYRPAIKLLQFELERIHGAIAALEQFAQTGSEWLIKGINARRGRKSMGPEERKEVAERMRRYWAARRKRKVSVANIIQSAPARQVVETFKAK